MIKGRIVKEGYDLSVELLRDDQFWGELTVSEEEGKRLTLTIDREIEGELSFDYDEFSKVLGKAAERLWKMHQEQPERGNEDEEEEDSYDFDEPAEEADSPDRENVERENGGQEDDSAGQPEGEAGQDAGNAKKAE